MLQLEETGLLLPESNTNVKVENSMSCFGCDLCCLSNSQCQMPDNLDAMRVTRSVESAQEIFNLLVNEEGEIRKAVRDYEIRQGQTREPIL